MACFNLFEICSYENGGVRTKRHIDQVKDWMVEQKWHYTLIKSDISSIVQ